MSILNDTAPKRIWLCVSDDVDDYDLPYPELYPEDAEITWSTDQPVAVTIEYVRNDLSEIARLRQELTAAQDSVRYNAHRAELAEGQLVAARALINDLAALCPGVYYMDPPDGGAPTLVEQLQRMAKDAKRYAWIRDNHEVRGRAMEIVYGMNGSDWDAAIDAALAGGKHD